MAELRQIIEAKAKELCTMTGLVGCKADDTLEEAVEQMRNENIGAVVVVDDDQRPVGIITERDIVRKVAFNPDFDGETPVSKVMTPNPKTIRLDHSVKMGLVMMRMGRFRHVVVVDDDGRFTGMLSIKDALDFLLDKLTE